MRLRGRGKKRKDSRHFLCTYENIAPLYFVPIWGTAGRIHFEGNNLSPKNVSPVHGAKRQVANAQPATKRLALRRHSVPAAPRPVLFSTEFSSLSRFGGILASPPPGRGFLPEVRKRLGREVGWDGSATERRCRPEGFGRMAALLSAVREFLPSVTWGQKVPNDTFLELLRQFFHTGSSDHFPV